MMFPGNQAAIAQLGERQTEDLKVPASIPGLGMLQSQQSSVTCPRCKDSDVTVNGGREG